MHSDYVFRKGSSHTICQDYAVAGRDGGIAFAILSDGCSGSPSGEPGSPFTDFGSRFLVRAARQQIAGLAGGAVLERVIVDHASSVARHCGLPREAIDATLLVAVIHEDSKLVRVYQTGDGVVAARRRDGAFEFWTTEFSGGAPFYLSYLLDGKAREALDAMEQSVVVTSADSLGKSVPFDAGLTSEINVCQRRYFHADHYDLVLLLSDGAESFQTKDGQTVPLGKVLEQVFAIKGFAGQFLGRRCRAFLESFCADQGWRHTDDFSVAGIYLGAAP